MRTFWGCSEVTAEFLAGILYSGFNPQLCHPPALYRPHSPAGQTTINQLWQEEMLCATPKWHKVPKYTIASFIST